MVLDKVDFQRSIFTKDLYLQIEQVDAPPLISRTRGGGGADSGIHR